MDAMWTRYLPHILLLKRLLKEKKVGEIKTLFVDHGQNLSNNLGNLLNSNDDNVSSADIVDQASSYTDKSVEMKALNRSRKLISKINSALQRIKDGTYGFCEETGEPIGLKRLMARPVATLSIEAQERHERDEKIFIDD